MNELIGFEYYQPKVNSSKRTTLDNKATLDKLWPGELFIYYRNNEYRLCVKLGSDFVTETKTGKFFVNAYDVLEEKFYNLDKYDEIFKFYGKIRIKGENIYGKFDFSLITPVLYDVHIKLSNEIERDKKDCGSSSTYRVNSKYNVLTLYCNACYFNSEYISNEDWEAITHESEASIKNNCEVEIKIGGELRDGILGAEWVGVPF